MPAASRVADADHADRISQELDVRKVLASVPEEFRAVLVLHDMQDLPLEEVAAILELPIGTVKSRCHRARLALGRALEGEREHAGGSGASEGASER
jgi:RNA polymerase sigma-70 factor (ECF subfamily)